MNAISPAGTSARHDRMVRKEYHALLLAASQIRAPMITTKGKGSLPRPPRTASMAHTVMR